MAHEFSKENQSSVDTAYRFGGFELHPSNRLLKQDGAVLSLQPKAFDALFCLVGRAGHLVSKQELIRTLWPSVHVSEANLTNIIVGLRKAVGRSAIRTVSKHGYRFELPVAGEPGIRRDTYEKFARAKELTAQRSLESMHLARDLYWICLADDPTFAAAWAWLGRCSWFLDKFGHRHSHSPSTNFELAQAAFERAFAIDPELASAHQFYTFVEVDTGHAAEAMHRLLQRLERHPGEPESLAGLVQVFRFRGLFHESLEAHKRATQLDPAIATSVAHTLFLAGDYAASIETYSGRAAYYLDAAAWAALGDHKRAIILLTERLDRMELSLLMTALMRSLLALLKGKTREAVRLMQTADTTREPEVLVYFARHYARLGRSNAAISSLRLAANAGFVCAPTTLKNDVWLRSLRSHAEFPALLASAEALVEQARSNLGASTKNGKIRPL